MSEPMKKSIKLNFEELKHVEKKNLVGTSVLLSENQHRFLKEHDFNLSLIVRREVDRLMALWERQSEKVD